MKKLNIAATGYYGSTESWKWVASAYEMIAEVLGKLINYSDPVIITGLDTIDGNVTDGFIAYKGELFRFESSPLTDTVVIIEDVTGQEYNTDPSGTGTMPVYPTYIDRYAKCGQSGDGVDEFLFSDFRRLSDLINISDLTKQATEDSRGTLPIATQDETNNGADDTKAITPAKLAGRVATTEMAGIIPIATEQDVIDGVADKALTPAGLNVFWQTGIIKGTVETDQWGAYTVNLPVTITDANYIVLASVRSEGQDDTIVIIGELHDNYFTFNTMKSSDPTATGGTQNYVDYMVVKL